MRHRVPSSVGGALARGLPPAPGKSRVAASARPLTAAALRAWPLPEPLAGGDKEARGRVLVIAGNNANPGAALLAAVAALRAGAGKLQIATTRTAAVALGVAVPEAMVLALDETRGGALSSGAARRIEQEISRADAVLVGPGMLAVAPTRAVVRRAIAAMGTGRLVLDATALDLAHADLRTLRGLQGRVVLTPHAGEMARLVDQPRSRTEACMATLARRVAEAYGVVIAGKGEETYIAAPGGPIYVNRAGNAGLGTSGSGDVLAGLIAGLCARGAPPQQAAAWGVALHARAGDVLARRMGPLGYLARELAGEVPALMRRLQR